MGRARNSKPTAPQIYLWTLDVQQQELAVAIDRTERAITAMLKGENRLNPAAAHWIAEQFDHQTAAELERLCTIEFEGHPTRPKNRKQVSA